MIWHPSLTGIISCDFSRLKLKCELGKSKDDGTTGAHGILPKCINWSTIELNLKRKEFSSITFNSASLSRRAMARRWSPIGHCLASLGRIDRHNLEKYFSYSHSFHWHSKREKLFGGFRNDISRATTHSIFLPCPKVLQALFPRRTPGRPAPSEDAFSRYDHSKDNREDYRK